MLSTPPRTVELTVPRECCPRSRPEVCLRRRAIGRTDLVKLRGLWLTDKPLTALEAAAAIPDGSVFLDRALQRHVPFPRVYRAYCRNLGSHGSARQGALLVAAADRADSAAERRAVALLRVAGLDSSLLTAIADASPDKHDRRMPGTDVPVVAPHELVAARPDVVLLFVSDLLDEVCAALPEIEAAGGRWVDAGAGR